MLVGGGGSVGCVGWGRYWYGAEEEEGGGEEEAMIEGSIL